MSFWDFPVRAYPVAATVASLVLFVGGWIITVILNPIHLMAGSIFKGIVVVGLVKAIRSARAYEKELEGNLGENPETNSQQVRNWARPVLETPPRGSTFDFFALIGIPIHGPQPRSLASWIFGVIACLLLFFAALASKVHLAILAIFPGVFAVLYRMIRPAPFVMEFTHQGLGLPHLGLFLPYEKIEEVRARPPHGKRGNFPIQVGYETGFVKIPEQIDAASEEVYQFLRSLEPAEPAERSVHSVLADYLRRQEENFGPDNVQVYRARTRFAPSSGYRYAKAFFLGFFLTGLFWFPLVFLDKGFRPWGIMGLFLVILGGFFWFLVWLVGGRNVHPRIKNWRQASLILSPQGLALIQGDLRGEMKWEELHEVRSSPPAFVLTPGESRSGLYLHVDGAVIHIANIYNRPLEAIHQRIRNYWGLRQ